MEHLKICGVSIFLEKRKTRLLVGELRKVNNMFIFTYDSYYFKAKHVIPLGPEFPLTERSFTSSSLFPSFEDRLPSTLNPAYPEYCLAMGIDPQEKDPFVLLSTIGQKGPSSFIFYPLFEQTLHAEAVIKYRHALGLTTREFASVFELSQASLNALERKRIVGSEITKRLLILISFPKVAQYLLKVNGGYLTYEKWQQAFEMLQKMQATEV